MAYRRSLLISARNYAHQRFSPSFAYVRHDDDRSKQSFLNEDPKINILGRRGFVGTRSNNLLGFGEICQDRRSSQMLFPTLNGSVFARNMCTMSRDYTEAVEAALGSQAPNVSEVAVAAADSFFPVAALQHLIDGVHNFTGLNWWASIVVTTILVRGITIPFMINHPLRDIRKLSGSSHAAANLREKRMSHIQREYDVQYTPFSAKLIGWSVCLSFYFAIDNMVEKIPSFTSGGALWFTDLTTADTYFILPILSALTYLIRIQSDMPQKDSNLSITINTRYTNFDLIFTGRNRLPVLAVVIIPFFFPKAFFCYWITSNMFMIIFKQALQPSRD